MLLILFCLALMYALAVIFSPFPYWKTYLVLWKTLLTHKEPAIGLQARIRQAGFLVNYALFCPLWTLLWMLDSILYPEYKKVAIRPVFIVGQPRSGTTFLHRTLATDSKNFLAIRHIEWRFPFICVQKILSKSGLARSIARRNYWPNSVAGQIAAKMHPNKLSDWEEDGIFYEECFLHHFFVFLRFPYPHLLAYLDDFPALPESVQEKILQTHHQVIQKIMFLRGGGAKYYLSKEVTSHNKFPKMLKRYPEAKFIFSLRPSADFVSSLVSLVRFSTNSKIGVDPRDIPSWEAVFLDRMQKDGELLVHLCQDKIAKDNQVRLVFNWFTWDPGPAVEYLYGKFGIDLPPSYREYLVSLHRDQKIRDRGYEYEKKVYLGFDGFDRFVQEIDSVPPLVTAAQGGA